MLSVMHLTTKLTNILKKIQYRNFIRIIKYIHIKINVQAFDAKKEIRMRINMFLNYFRNYKLFSILKK